MNAMVLAICALANSFRRGVRNVFKPRRPVEIALPSETTSTLDHLRAHYSIDIAVPGAPVSVSLQHGQYIGSIEGQPASAEEANRYVPLFAEEFGLYPPLLVRATRLRNVVLCRKLLRSQKPKPGILRLGSPSPVDCQPLSYVRRPCGGVPDGEHGVLYLAVTWGGDDDEYMRKLIHHEFYHCVQRRQFGGYGDPRWSSLNSPEFDYGPGGLAANYSTDPTFWVMPGEEWGHGFLNHYSLSAPEEDQAEIFAHLLTEPARVEMRMRTDDILRQKVERLKYTLKEFCRDMDEGFWRRVEESRWPYGL